MAYLEKRTTKAGKIRWRVQIRLQGHPLQHATFARRADALEWAQRREAALKAGEHFPHRSAHERTVGDLLIRYQADVLPHKSAQARRNHPVHLTWWRTTLGHHPLSHITPQLLSQCRDHLAVLISPATINRYFSTLSAVYETAIRDWGWCAENPVRAVRKPQEPRGRVRYLSETEREQLLLACKASSNPSLSLLVVLALCTGARRGELLTLRWQDIDLSRGMCTFEQTKNNERRSVPLAPPARAMLWDAYHTRDTATPWVFVGKEGQALTDPKRAWHTACQKAGIEDFRFHDLRHSCASYLAMSGASLLEIAEILGHKTLAMVRRYAHLSERHTASVVDRMAEKFMGER